MHCDPNWRDSSAKQFGTRDRGGVDGDLVGTGPQQHVDVGHRAHPAADGQRDEHLLCGALDDLQHRGPARRRSGHVEERQLVGTLAS
jgi:hypothetical protein